MHRSLACVVAIIVVTSATAVADAPPALLGSLRGMPPAVLVGAFGGGHGHAVRAPHGWFLGADIGWAWIVGATDVATRATADDRTNSWCFGARAGYQFESGLAVQARFDRLGVAAPDGSGSIALASAGVRYSIPIVPMPFAEVQLGTALHGSDASAAVGVGIGASLVVARHLAFDLSLRDWIVDIDGIHNAPTVMLGVTAGFGG
jgi:hypothetical protein